MAVNPLASAFRLQTPSIHASPTRYSIKDTEPEAENNRTVGQFADFVPWVEIEGGVLQVIGHDTDSNGRSTNFFDNGSSQKTPLEGPPEQFPQQYVAAEIGENPGEDPSYQVALSQLGALIEVRDYSSDNLGELYPQAEFQKEAAKFAIRKRWEQAVITGNVGDGQFDGLGELVSSSQTAAALTTGDPLRDLDLAMTRVTAHNRRVDLIVTHQLGWFNILRLLREAGLEADIRTSPVTGAPCLYYRGVPVCLNDHVLHTTVPPNQTPQSDVFFMTLGEPDGVFAIVNKNNPEVTIKQTHDSSPPFMSYQADFYSALVVASDLALFRVSDWPALP